MIIEMSPINYTIAVLIILSCFVIIIFRKSHGEYDGPAECFNCNKESCAGCIIGEIKAAYVQRLEYGKVVATCTLTFRDDFVISQSPAGGDEKWDIPNFVGCYKTVVAKWVNGGSGPVDNRIASFS